MLRILRIVKRNLVHLKADVNLSYYSIRARIFNGKKLSEPDIAHIKKTSGDIFRLIPLTILGMVPGGSVLLPLAIRYAPFLLPTSFQSRQVPDNVIQLLPKDMVSIFKNRVDKLSVSLLETNPQDLVTIHERTVIHKLSLQECRYLQRMYYIKIPGVSTMRSGGLRFALNLHCSRIRTDDILLLEGLQMMSSNIPVPEKRERLRPWFFTNEVAIDKILKLRGLSEIAKKNVLVGGPVTTTTTSLTTTPPSNNRLIGNIRKSDYILCWLVLVLNERVPISLCTLAMNSESSDSSESLTTNNNNNIHQNNENIEVNLQISKKIM
jgi:hypothetical protein